MFLGFGNGSNKVAKGIFATIAAGILLIPISQVSYAQSGSVVVLSSSMFVDSLDYHHVAGEVQNNSSNPVQNIQITATFYDAAKTVVGTSFTYSTIEKLRVGEKSPFEIVLFNNEVEGVASYKLTVSASRAYSMPAAYLQLDVGTSNVDSLGYYHIVGEVTNEATEEASSVLVAGAFYDNSGKVIGTGFTYTQPEELAAGETAPFELVVFNSDIGSEIESAELNVQSNEYAMINNDLPAAAEDEEQQNNQEQPQAPAEKTGTNTISLSTITFQDVNENAVTNVQSGSMILLTTTLTNNNAKTQPFTIVMEVRDKDGVTQSLQIQKGTLNPSGTAEVGVSWIASSSGTYEVRTFSVTSLKNPEFLSSLATKTLSVK